MLTRRQALSALCAAVAAVLVPIPELGAAEAIPSDRQTEDCAPRFDCCDATYPTMTVDLGNGETYTLYLQPDGSYQFNSWDGKEVRVTGVADIAGGKCPLSKW